MTKILSIMIYILSGIVFLLSISVLALAPTIFEKGVAFLFCILAILQTRINYLMDRY